MLRCILTFVLSLVLAWLIYLNLSLYYQPRFTRVGPAAVNEDVLAQLRFLRDELRGGAGERMQAYYPEGFLFMNALYGLSWCETAQPLDHRSPGYTEALQEVSWALQQIQSPRGRQSFDSTLTLPYGAFYAGWSNLLLGRKLALQSPAARNEADIQRFRQQCGLIARALENPRTPYPESYGEAAWPADVVLCAASLALYNGLFDQRYAPTLSHWVRRVQSTLDPATGLIPHAVDYRNGRTMDADRGSTRGFTRGSSQSLMHCFLYSIDSVFARQQFLAYKQQFVDYRLGLPGIREYPHGSEGRGDIDSGPVLFGIGGAASIVGLKAMRLHGEWEISEGLRRSVEAFGMPLTRDGRKKYLFGLLPMADAFIAWANATPPSASQSHRTFLPLTFHLISLAVFLTVTVLLYAWWKSALRKRKAAPSAS